MKLKNLFIKKNSEQTPVVTIHEAIGYLTIKSSLLHSHTRTYLSFYEQPEIFKTNPTRDQPIMKELYDLVYKGHLNIGYALYNLRLAHDKEIARAVRIDNLENACAAFTGAYQFALEQKLPDQEKLESFMKISGELSRYADAHLHPEARR